MLNLKTILLSRNQ